MYRKIHDKEQHKTDKNKSFLYRRKQKMYKNSFSTVLCVCLTGKPFGRILYSTRTAFTMHVIDG